MHRLFPNGQSSYENLYLNIEFAQADQTGSSSVLFDEDGPHRPADSGTLHAGGGVYGCRLLHDVHRVADLLSGICRMLGSVMLRQGAEDYANGCDLD